MNQIIRNFFSSNLLKRLLSSIILIPIVISIFKIGGLYFITTFLMVAVIMAFEWAEMVKRNRKWQMFGLFYIVLSTMSLIHLRMHEHGFNLIIYLFITIWATDIGAYIFGSMIKGPKLAPKISPSKSWSGAISGLGIALISSSILVYFNLIPSKFFIYITFIISIAGQIGDLLESYFKRLFSIKDSGSIIPGHGGILDRMDSIMLAAPTLAMIIYLYPIYD